MEQVSRVSTEVSMRETILHLVKAYQGMKGVDLSITAMGIIGPAHFKSSEFLTTISELVKEGELIEIEFTFPGMEYRMKSFFLPKGTVIGIRMEVFNANKVKLRGNEEGPSL